MADRVSRVDRFVGGVLGLACGDALGAPAEFQSAAAVRARWGRLADMVGGGIWAPGEWTDDTGMALGVAEGILEDPENPVPRIGERFLLWSRTAKDVGTTVGAALAGFRGDWAEAARGTPQARQGKAAGNGSLMRTLPVALAYDNEGEMLRISARVSAMTHWDPQAEVCCALYCLWIRALLRGEPMLAAWRGALNRAQRVAGDGPLAPDTPGPAPLPEGFWARLRGVEAQTQDCLQPSGYAGYVVDCLEAAAWCCLNAADPEDALVRAVNLGGEADTIAAVAGGAAGACWGQAALPARWREALHDRERIERTGVRLAGLRGHQEIYALGTRIPPFEFFRVEERVWAGRNPLTARDVDRLASLGVTHVLDLREPKEWSGGGRVGQEAVDALDERGIERRHLPVPDTHAPDAATLDAAVGFLDAALAADPAARVFVHCRAGQQRTGAVLVAWHARSRGCTGHDALAAIQASCPRIKPLKEQRQAVERWLDGC